MNIHYTIHKVADLLGISADAIRLYERENHTVKSNMTALHDHTKDMQKIIGIIQQITADLAKYYPDLEQLGTTIAPLSGMVATINTARESKAKIEEMRANLLK